MSGFTGSYLRILTPQTIDGINVKYDKEREVIYKESHVANTKVARKYYEKANLKRPAQLRHIVEVVGEEEYKPTPKPNPQAQNIKGKPGPKPKPKELVESE